MNTKYFFTNNLYEFISLPYNSYTLKELRQYLSNKYFGEKNMINPPMEFKFFFKIHKKSISVHELVKIIMERFVMSEDMSIYCSFNHNQKPINIYSKNNLL